MRVAAIAMALVLVIAAPAYAETETVGWQGHGLDSLIECDDETEAYVHWVLTPGGQSDVEEADLFIDGEFWTSFTASGNQAAGAWHAVTELVGVPGEEHFQLNADVHAEVVGTLGDNALLVISDGCFEESGTPEPENGDDNGDEEPEPENGDDNGDDEERTPLVEDEEEQELTELPRTGGPLPLGLLAAALLAIGARLVRGGGE